MDWRHDYQPFAQQSAWLNVGELLEVFVTERPFKYTNIGTVNALASSLTDSTNSILQCPSEQNL